MDLLSQYKQDHPEAPRKKPSSSLTDEYGREYSRMVALVMRLSGGRIKDARQASYVLLGIAVIIALVSLVLFFRTGTPGPSGPIIPVAGPGTQ